MVQIHCLNSFFKAKVNFIISNELITKAKSYSINSIITGGTMKIGNGKNPYSLDKRSYT